jgi:hypothetical protein
MRFYPATKAARMAGISRENMNKRIKHGKVAAITKNGRHYVLDTTEPLQRTERLIKELSSDQYVPVKEVPIGAEFWRLADNLWLVHKDHAPAMKARTKRKPRRYPNGSIVFTVTLSDPGWQALQELHEQWSARESGPIFRQSVIQQAIALLDETQFDPEIARAWAAGYRVTNNKNRLVTRWTPEEYAQLRRVQTWYEQRMSEAGIGAGRRWSLGTPGRGRLCDFALFMALRSEVLTANT